MDNKTTPKRSRGRPKSIWSEPQGGTVQALDRGIILLKALAKEEKITLTELALRVGMPPSSAHRLLATLQKHHFVEFDETTQDWMIGVEAFRIGAAFNNRTSLLESGRIIMRELMQETGETANLAIADNGDIVFISQVETHNPIRAFFRPGTRSHMHSSGIGKALLANLSQKEVEKILQKKGMPEFTPTTLTSSEALLADLKKTKKRGWSLDNEERYNGMRCVASTIYNSFGEAIAGISVSGPTVRFDDHVVFELGPKVLKAAQRVTQLIGGKIQTNKAE